MTPWAADVGTKTARCDEAEPNGGRRGTWPWYRADNPIDRRRLFHVKQPWLRHNLHSNESHGGPRGTHGPVFHVKHPTGGG